MKPAVTVAWRLAVILCSIVSIGASASEALSRLDGIEESATDLEFCRNENASLCPPEA